MVQKISKQNFCSTATSQLPISSCRCVIYQLIRLNKLYKLMGSFFQIMESFFKLATIFQNNSGIEFMQAWTVEGEAFVLLSTRSSVIIYAISYYYI